MYGVRKKETSEKGEEKVKCDDVKRKRERRLKRLVCIDMKSIIKRKRVKRNEMVQEKERISKTRDRRIKKKRQ